MIRIILCFLITFAALADWPQEEKRINYLLSEIKSSGAVFIRNGDRHPSLKAYNHLKSKLERAQNSWFAPDKEEWTAEMFIEEIASKSSWSGRPYQIELPGKKPINSKIWLSEKLTLWNKNTASQNKKP